MSYPITPFECESHNSTELSQKLAKYALNKFLVERYVFEFVHLQHTLGSLKIRGVWNSSRGAKICQKLISEGSGIVVGG